MKLPARSGGKVASTVRRTQTCVRSRRDLGRAAYRRTAVHRRACLRDTRTRKQRSGAPLASRTGSFLPAYSVHGPGTSEQTGIDPEREASSSTRRPPSTMVSRTSRARGRSLRHWPAWPRARRRRTSRRLFQRCASSRSSVIASAVAKCLAAIRTKPDPGSAPSLAPRDLAGRSPTRSSPRALTDKAGPAEMKSREHVTSRGRRETARRSRQDRSRADSASSREVFRPGLRPSSRESPRR